MTRSWRTTTSRPLLRQQRRAAPSMEGLDSVYQDVQHQQVALFTAAPGVPAILVPVEVSCLGHVVVRVVAVL